MRKKSLYLLVIIAAAILLLMLGTTKVNADETIAYGDVDCNGIVQNKDVSLLTQYLEGKTELSERALKNADVNANGRVGYTDAELINKALVGKVPNADLPNSPITDFDLYSDWEYETNDNTTGIIITKYKGDESEITIPGIIDDLPVVSIEKKDNWSVFTLDKSDKFGASIESYNSTITKVIMSNTITKIGRGVFGVCRNLEEVKLSENLSQMEEQVFDGCISLKEITIPSTLKNIPNACFSGCINLENVVIEEGVEKINLEAFFGCKKINNITLPNTIKNIGSEAFSGCINISSIEWPLKLERIGEGAFSGTGLVNVEFKNNIKEIGMECFSNCPSLKYVFIPGSIQYIDYDAFSNSSNLETVRFGALENVGEIFVNSCGDNIFKNCDKLTIEYCKGDNRIKEYANRYNINCRIYAIAIKGLPLTYRHYPTYTGQEIKVQNLKITDDNYILQEGTDYEISYENNINVGTAQMIIIGKGNYIGTIYRELTIEPCSILYNTINKEIDTSMKKYTGGKITIPVSLKYDDYTLLEDKDYTVDYENNVEIGTATVTITGIGNFKDSIVKNFEIVDNENYKNISSNNIMKYYSQSNMTYLGRALEKNITLKDGDYTLVQNKDYTVEYKNNINVGTATVTVKGINYYSGEFGFEFEIVQSDISGTSNYYYNLDVSNKIYTGTQIKPMFSFKNFNGNSFVDYYEEGRDYIVKYENNINVGTATVIVTGINNCKGTITNTFNIVPKEINGDFEIKIKDAIYTGKEIRPAVSIKNGDKTLKEGEDYTVSYKNNINIGTATVTIEGKGNYTGKTSKTFGISLKSLSNISANINTSNKKYTGKAIKTAVTLKDGNTILKEGIDYTVAYKNNVKVGTATVTVTGKGNYYTGTITKTFKIVKADNTVSVSSSNKNVKYKNVKAKSQTVSAITVKKAQGKVTYSKTSGNKNFTVNKNTGKITVKKKTKKGTYSIKIKVKAAGNSNYNAKTKTVTIKIKVK